MVHKKENPESGYMLVRLFVHLYRSLIFLFRIVHFARLLTHSQAFPNVLCSICSYLPSRLLSRALQFSITSTKIARARKLSKRKKSTCPIPIFGTKFAFFFSSAFAFFGKEEIDLSLSKDLGRLMASSRDWNFSFLLLEREE